MAGTASDSGKKDVNITVNNQDVKNEKSISVDTNTENKKEKTNSNSEADAEKENKQNTNNNSDSAQTKFVETLNNLKFDQVKGHKNSFIKTIPFTEILKDNNYIFRDNAAVIIKFIIPMPTKQNSAETENNEVNESYISFVDLIDKLIFEEAEQNGQIIKTVVSCNIDKINSIKKTLLAQKFNLTPEMCTTDRIK